MGDDFHRFANGSRVEKPKEKNNMNIGTLHFKTAESLAAFIAALIPQSTACFEVFEAGDGSFTLTFSGGH